MASARDELLQRFPESGSARVLVVDDHEFMHRLIRVRLRGESLEVVSAWTCHEAIEKWSVRLRTVLAAARERARQADAQQNPQKVG